MSYTMQYGQIWPYLPTLAAGALLSLQIAFLAFCGGLALGTVGASILSFGGRITKAIVRAYVTFFTNTPQLVQIYFLYFALPDAGILLSSYAAVLIGMTLNAGAYLTDIQRAGFESVRGSEMEAAEVLGFSRTQQIRYVILPHVARVLFPPLSNQYILMNSWHIHGGHLRRRGVDGPSTQHQRADLPLDRGIHGHGGSLHYHHTRCHGDPRIDRALCFPRQDEDHLKWGSG